MAGVFALLVKEVFGGFERRRYLLLQFFYEVIIILLSIKLSFFHVPSLALAALTVLPLIVAYTCNAVMSNMTEM